MLSKCTLTLVLMNVFDTIILVHAKETCKLVKARWTFANIGDHLVDFRQLVKVAVYIGEIFIGEERVTRIFRC
jgi:hypothetical protein